MSTAKKRSVLMHSSSNAGGATVIANAAEGAMARFAFHFFLMVKHREEIRDSQLRRESRPATS
jgi:hypothetical protein